MIAAIESPAKGHYPVPDSEQMRGLSDKILLAINVLLLLTWK